MTAVVASTPQDVIISTQPHVVVTFAYIVVKFELSDL